MTNQSALRRRQARIQALTYLAAGVGMMLFLMLHLGPRAQAERLAARARLDVGIGGSSAAPVPASSQATAAPAAVAPAAVIPAEPSPPPAAGATADEPNAAATTGAPTAAATAGEPGVEPAAATSPDQPSAATPTAAPAPTSAKPGAAEGAAQALPPSAQVTRFTTGTATLTAGQRVQIQRAAKLLLATPSLRATVRGHADRRGDDGENAPLSEARARAVAEALAQEGVTADRLDVDAAGSQRPLDPGDTPTAYARNRRVEIEFHWKEAP